MWPGSSVGPGRPWREPPAGPSPPAPPRPWRRERFLARRLRGLASRHRRVVHLGGWEHLVEWQDSPGLWGDLADFNPLRVLLDEADDLPDF